MFDVKGKIALVTGANRGIGKAYVETLVKLGASKVYAAGRDLALVEEVVKINPEVISPVKLDVTNAAQIEALKSNIPALDLLINNAGIANGTFSIGEDAVEIARLEMDTNYFGPLQIIHALLDKLKASENGAIVNVSSIVGYSNFPALGPYSATKAAIKSLSEGLRIELDGTNIEIFGVYPGPIETRLTEGMEMPKGTTTQVAEETFDGMASGKLEIFPDDFSKQMSGLYFDHPEKLAEAFKQMHL